MNVALAYSSPAAPNFGIPSASTGIIGRKAKLFAQFAHSAFDATRRTAQNITSNLGENWKPMAAGMVAGAGFQMGVKLITAHFVAAGVAATLPGAVVTVATGAIAGSGVFLVKTATETYFYNLKHKNAKRSYREALLSREAVIKALTGAAGGILGAEFIANNPAIMSSLQNMGMQFTGALTGSGVAITRRITETLSGTFLHNVLSSEKRKNFRSALFSKQALLSTALGAVLGFAGGEVIAHRNEIGNSNIGERVSGFFRFMKNHFSPIASAHAEAYKLPGEVKCPDGTAHIRCVEDPIALLPGWMKPYVVPHTVASQLASDIAAPSSSSAPQQHAAEQIQPHQSAAAPATRQFIKVASSDPIPNPPGARAPAYVQTINTGAEPKALVEKALNGQLPPQEAIVVLGNQSFNLANYHHDPATALQQIKVALDIANKNNIHSPLTRLLEKNYADLNARVAPEPTSPPPAAVDTTLPADTLPPDSLKKLPHWEQLDVQKILNGQAPKNDPLAVLKDASYKLSGGNHNDQETALKLLQKGVEMAKEGGKENTLIGKMLQRDLTVMEKKLGHSTAANDVFPMRPSAANAPAQAPTAQAA